VNAVEKRRDPGFHAGVRAQLVATWCDRKGVDARMSFAKSNADVAIWALNAKCAGLAEVGDIRPASQTRWRRGRDSNARWAFDSTEDS
jgi:hypothetical protein